MTEGDRPIEGRLATCRGDYAAAFSLLHDSYVERRFITPSASGIHYRLSFGLPTTRTIVVSEPTGWLLGTLSVVGDGRLGLPLESLYPAEIHQLRAAGRRLGEVSGLAIATPARSSSLTVFTALTRFLFQYASWRALDELVIAVHPRNARFYQRRFGFHPFGPVRRYQAVGYQPAVPCRVAIADLDRLMPSTVYEAHFGTPIDPHLFIVPPMTSQLHLQFCGQAGLLAHEADLDKAA